MAMSRFRYTEEMIEYIRKNARDRGNIELTKMFNEKFETDRKVTQIGDVKRRHKIKSNHQHKWTKEQIDYLRSIAKGRSREEIKSLVNKKFGLSLRKTQIRSTMYHYNIKNGMQGYSTRFKSGHETWSKGMKGLNLGGEAGWFKKGQSPINAMDIGAETLSQNGFIKIKISDNGNKKDWKLKHRHVWESAYGDIPENHFILFLDGDKTNCDIENLVMINRGILYHLKRVIGYSDDPEENKVRLKLAELKSTIKRLELTGGNEEGFKKYSKIAESNGITHQHFTQRVRNGWSFERAATEKIKKVRSGVYD